jgi:glycosyltransferase involved in cell wall biosynthesis
VSISPGDASSRIAALYLAPWVDYGGSDKGTIDWFRWIDRGRFAPSLITTQPSANRRLSEIYPFAEEVWALTEHMAGLQFPKFIFDFLHTRDVQVLHIMNSRLGYELLPDLAALPRPPVVVVQLHVEEPDRSGYVRYVTTRYGNLVDAFSVSSRHLAQAVEGYDVPPSKIHVIPTGVDGSGHFNPERVTPIESGHEPGTFRVLFAGRLTDQKDPMLMLEVARRVVARHAQVRFDVVGDGPLEEAFRARVRELGLERNIRMHPSTPELERWLRAADLVLMTSMFEGVPYVIYEALAMGVPVVAPDLPGNAEVMDVTGGQLVTPRDDAGAYAEAIGRFVDDEPLRKHAGKSGRARMLESFSLRGMAEHHEALYDTLLAARDAPARRPSHAPLPAPLRFSERPAKGEPLVSIVTPCFNHGRYLPELIAGVVAQDYPAIEVIIVDDASTDPLTIETLAQLEAAGTATVVRQTVNGGPSVARNRAISAAKGRYILPVDADNILLPGAVRSMVQQLQAAGERVGFIYAGFQYFGNRDYTFEPPEYNLFSLLQGNYVDTCSLLDREIFDAGLSYPADIKLGHEDWDLVLSLGARDVIGKPSRQPVMLYRKHGFTRSDLVEYHRLPFWREIRGRHPELYGSEDDVGTWGRYRGPSLRTKTRWSPSLSIICANPLDFSAPEGAALLNGLAQQSCGDFELIVECPRVPATDACRIRRLPPGLARSSGERLVEALDLSLGRYLLLAAAPADLFADRTSVEKLLRGLYFNLELSAVALTDAGAQGRFPFRLLEQVQPEFSAHAVAWPRAFGDAPPDEVLLEDGNEIGQLARIFHRRTATVQWRHFPANVPATSTAGRPACALRLSGRRGLAAPQSRQLEHDDRMRRLPALPSIPEGRVSRWGGSAAWMPPETRPLVRHAQLGGEQRILSNHRDPPAGFKIEFDLGSIQAFSPPGTVRLVIRDGRPITVPRGSERLPDDVELGHLEEAPLPLFIGVERAVLPDGSETLVAGTDRDLLRSSARELTFLGFIESFPQEPVHRPPYTAPPPGQVLARFVDRAARSHRYGVLTGSAAAAGAGELAAVLGQLMLEGGPGSIPVWVDARGHLCTDRYRPADASPDPRQLARWTLAPANWRGFGHRSGRARAVARRAADSALQASIRRPSAKSRGHEAARSRAPIGYLHEHPGPERIELFAAMHPVLSDQFVTDLALEATHLGYTQVTSLGYIDRATDDSPAGVRRVAIPWASRFGLAAR